MKVLYYRDTVHYRRPDDDPDVKEWEKIIASQRNSLYHIETEPDEEEDVDMHVKEAKGLVIFILLMVSVALAIWFGGIFIA